MKKDRTFPGIGKNDSFYSKPWKINDLAVEFFDAALLFEGAKSTFGIPQVRTLGGIVPIIGLGQTDGEFLF